MNGRALELASQSVTDSYVDLGPVERAVTGIQLPLARITFWSVARYGCVSVPGTGKIGKGSYRFSLRPGLEFAEIVVRPGRELEVELEPEKAVDVLHEIEQGANLVLDLSYTQSQPRSIGTVV